MKVLVASKTYPLLRLGADALPVFLVLLVVLEEGPRVVVRRLLLEALQAVCERP